MIAECFPAHVLTFFGGLKVSGQQFEFLMGDLNLAQVETNAELRVGDISASKFVKVTEEFTNTNTLLRADLSDAGTNVLNILWCVANNFSFGNSWSSLRVVVK